jgi:predicted site-specific integrase-resolvase
MAINNIKINDILDDQEYSVVECSQLLSITSQTISKYLRDGEVKGIKKGPKGKWFIKGGEIKKVIGRWNML